MPKLKISRSYSRKLNRVHYGGNDYETSDHFALYEIELDNTENGVKWSKKLLSWAKDDVNKAVKKEIKEIQKEGNLKDKVFNGEEPASFKQIIKIQQLAKENKINLNKLYEKNGIKLVRINPYQEKLNLTKNKASEIIQKLMAGPALNSLVSSQEIKDKIPF